MEQLLQHIDTILITAAAVVGAASMILAGLRKIADITPSTVDDEWLNKAEKALALVVKLLDRLALNPDADAARKAKKDKAE